MSHCRTGFHSHLVCVPWRDMDKPAPPTTGYCIDRPFRVVYYSTAPSTTAHAAHHRRSSSSAKLRNFAAMDAEMCLPPSYLDFRLVDSILRCASTKYRAIIRLHVVRAPLKSLHPPLPIPRHSFLHVSRPPCSGYTDRSVDCVTIPFRDHAWKSGV